MDASTPPNAPPPAPTKKPTGKERLKKLFEQYGAVAIGVFAVLYVSVLAGIWIAVKAGWKPDSAAGQAGTFGATYLMFRLTFPLRLGATAVLTPIVAKVLERLRLRKPRPPALP